MILRKIIKIYATRCQIIRLKCTQIVFDWGSAPDPAGELTALPRHPSWIKGGLLLREDGGMGREGKGGTPIFYCTPSSSFLEICLTIPLKCFLECPLTAPLRLTRLSARSASFSAPLTCSVCVAFPVAYKVSYDM